jgi:cell division protein FtsW
MLRYSSIVLCFAVAALVALGLVMLASTSVWVPRHEPYHFLERQSIMVGIGLIAAIAAANLPPDKLRRFAPWMLLGTCILLGLCYMPGVGIERLGSKRWVNLGILPEFQPSEPAKIVTVVVLAAWFARWQTEVHTFWRGFIVPGIIAGTPILLIAGQTDVGTALALAVAVGAVLFCVGTRHRFTIPTALLVLGLAVWFVLNDENRYSRIEAWLDLEAHQLGKGRQQFRALLALGNGGPWGVGLGNGLEKFGNLTYAHIDFIFPVIGEELGMPFTLGVVFCYVLIAVGGVGIAVRADNIFNRCLALGITCVIVVPAIVNIGVTTALLPNDGLPLPFVSYGGTNLVFSLAAVGLLVGISRRTRAVEARRFPLDREGRVAMRL